MWSDVLAVSSIALKMFRLVWDITSSSLRRLTCPSVPRPLFRQSSRPPVHCRRVASSSHMPPLCCCRVSLHCSGCLGARLFTLGLPRSTVSSHSLCVRVAVRKLPSLSVAAWDRCVVCWHREDPSSGHRATYWPCHKKPCD